jgi:signal transduction histidine kinase
MSVVHSIVRHTSDIVLGWLRKEQTTLGARGDARQRTEAGQREAGARQADRRQEEFLSVLVHDLRNMLAPISTAAQLLKYTDPDLARIHETSDIITRQVGHITSLFDDLRDVSLLQQGRLWLNVSPQDIKTVLSEAIEQAGPLLADRHHHLELELDEDDICVMGEYARLVQVFVKLLNNAARYTPPGGEIVLSAAVTARSVEIRVRDNGAGIAPDVLPHVFELFTQAEHATDRRRGGLGLGLALARNLVELHDGTVDAFSKGPGAGSCFTVILPLIEESTMMPNDYCMAAKKVLPVGQHRT